MDILKNLLSGIFKVVLLVCVFLLLLNFSINAIFKDGISSIINNNLLVIPEFSELDIDSEKVIELVGSDEVKELVMGYVDPILGSDVDVDSVNIGADILNFIINNKTQIEEVVGQPIDIVSIEEFTKSEEMNKINEQYKETISQTSGVVPVEVKNMIYAYGFFFTNQFRVMMFIVCAITIGFIMLIERSFHTWMKSVGKTLTGCGILIGVFIFAGSKILMNVLETFEFGVIMIDYKNGLTCAIISLMIGIVLLIVHGKVERRIRERSILNEVSAFSK